MQSVLNIWRQHLKVFEALIQTKKVANDISFNLIFNTWYIKYLFTSYVNYKSNVDNSDFRSTIHVRVKTKDITRYSRIKSYYFYLQLKDIEVG